MDISVDSITKDLTAGQDRPLWPLSSYGPAKHVPNVIQGLDESPEELRCKAFTATKAGSMQDYVRNSQVMLNKYSDLLVDEI